MKIISVHDNYALPAALIRGKVTDLENGDIVLGHEIAAVTHSAEHSGKPATRFTLAGHEGGGNFGRVIVARGVDIEFERLFEHADDLRAFERLYGSGAPEMPPGCKLVKARQLDEGDWLGSGQRVRTVTVAVTEESSVPGVLVKTESAGGETGWDHEYALDQLVAVVDGTVTQQEVDFCFDDMGTGQLLGIALEEFIKRLDDAGVWATAEILSEHGPGGGWPEIRFTHRKQDAELFDSIYNGG